MSPNPCPTANTGSRRYKAYAKSATPPRRLRYQNSFGMITRRARSETIHWMKKREPKMICPRKPTAYQAAFGETALIMRAPPDLVPQQPGLEPANSEQIAQTAKETVPHPIFGNASLARTMKHRHLDHARTAELAERGKESVRADEERQILQRLAPVRLERASDVADRVADHRASHRIRDPGRDAAAPGIGSMLSDARDHHGCLERGQNLPNARGVILAVGIQSEDQVPARVSEAGRQRPALADVPLQQDTANARVAPGAVLDPVGASIRASVVHE